MSSQVDKRSRWEAAGLLAGPARLRHRMSPSRQMQLRRFYGGTYFGMRHNRQGVPRAVASFTTLN